MPRSFLITNRRYELTPPPTQDLVIAPISSSFPYLAFSLPADVQEEAEDLSIRKKQDTDQDTEQRSSASCEDPSPSDSVTHLTFQHGLKALLSPPTSVAGSSGTESVASVSPSSSDTSCLLTGDNHVCLECGKRYSTSSNLARHRQTHRSVTDKKARKCPHCEKVYVSMPAFSMHVRTHSQGCQCRFCGKCFSRPWLLQGHVRTHTGEKPFTCHICSKSFADKSNLRAHVQTHSTSKPYICERCGKAFALKSYLYKHEESSCMRLHRRENHRRASNTNIGQQTPTLTAAAAQDGSQELSSSGPSCPSSPATPSLSAQIIHPRKAFVLQYNASLMQLQSLSPS